jgi:[ribosomal protein S18]-alanine N-acetyltransferase
VTIVPMTPAHIDALMPYERDMFGSEAWTASGYRAELADAPNRYYIVALAPTVGPGASGGEVALAPTVGPGASGGRAPTNDLLGWAGVMVVGDSAEILTVGVVPAARRRGLAVRLLDGLLAEARERGAVEAFLEVRVDNEAARKLYEREGFVQVGLRPGYYDHGRVDAVVMRREL